MGKSIDLDAQPGCPEGLLVFLHRLGGQFKLNPALIQLFKSPEQVAGTTIDGTELHAIIAEKAAFNACLLDHFIANPDDIPDKLKNIGYVYFWDTLYRAESDREGADPFVRWLRVDNEKVTEGQSKVNSTFYTFMPAVVRSN